MRGIAPVAALAAVLVASLAFVGLDLSVPSEATSRPDPVEAGPAEAGAWYCAAAATDGDNTTSVIAAAPPDQPGVAEVELAAHTGSSVTPLPSQQIFAGAAHSFDVPDGSPTAGIAGRWREQPAVLSRVWNLSAPDLPPGIVSGPCASSPSPTWYVPGMTTAGGARARLYVLNPFATDASVSIAFTTPSGLEEPIRLENVSVLSRGLTVVDVNEYLPLEPDLGVVVTARSGRVVVEGVQLVDAAIDGVDGASLVPAAPRTAETWTIPWSIGEPGAVAVEPPDATATDAPVDEETEEPTTEEPTTEEPTVEEPTVEEPSPDATDEGAAEEQSAIGPAPTPYPGDGTSSWVWVSNPSDTDATVTLTLHTAVGGVVPDLGDQLVVGAGEVLRVDLRGTLPPDVSTAGVTVRSENGVGIVAGVASLLRPESGDPATTGFTTVLGVPRPDAGWVLPGERVGTRRQVVHVVNPGADTAVVDVVLWNGSLVRRPAELQGIEVAPGAMADVDVSAALTDAPQMVVHVVATEGRVVAGRHSVSPAGQRSWVAQAGVPYETWSGGEVVPPVDHAPNLVRQLGTGRGVPIVEDDGIIDETPTELDDLLEDPEASDAPTDPASEPAREPSPAPTAS